MGACEPLIDGFGRQHTYLRISVTDRCNFRCTYCLPAEGLEWKPRAEILSFEEISRLVRIFAGLGIEKIRLTGGEPTLRSDITNLVAAISEIDGITDLAMTTNGYSLSRLAPALARAGLKRINISLDSIDPTVFSRLTRGGRLDRVLAGITAARAAGLCPIRINAVILEGENDHEVGELVEFFSRWADTTELRFIEYMPFEARWHKCVPAAELRRRLSQRWTLSPEPDTRRTAGPARNFRIHETGLRVGFISPLSNQFCASCNRLRLMADGHLRTCLAHDGTPSLRALIREGRTDDQLAVAIRKMVAGKPLGHSCEVDGGQVFEGVMTGIGG